jgi:hypothetical protein
MDNNTYLAQMGHFLAGALIILAAGVFGGETVLFIVLAIGVVAAAIKEFWFDLRFELPKQTWGDSIMDFGFYMLGAAIGVGLYFVAHAAHRLV